MSTANRTTNDTPVPRKHIVTVASEHSISEAALTGSLEDLYGSLFEGADAIHQYQVLTSPFLAPFDDFTTNREVRYGFVEILLP